KPAAKPAAPPVPQPKMAGHAAYIALTPAARALAALTDGYPARHPKELIWIYDNMLGHCYTCNDCVATYTVAAPPDRRTCRCGGVPGSRVGVVYWSEIGRGKAKRPAAIAAIRIWQGGRAVRIPAESGSAASPRRW